MQCYLGEGKGRSFTVFLLQLKGTISQEVALVLLRKLKFDQSKNLGFFMLDYTNTPLVIYSKL